MTDTILIQAYKPLFPLIDALQRQGRYRVAIWDNFHPDRIQAEIEMESYFKQDDDRLRDFRKESARQMAEVLNAPAFRAQFHWKGKDILGPIVSQFQSLLNQCRGRQVELIEGFRCFWDERHPKLVVLSNDTMPHTKTLTRAAQQLGVPVLHVLHGSAADDYGLELFADHLAVFGERDREQYIQAGGNRPDQITITGAGAWDYCARYRDSANQNALRDKLGIPTDQPCVLFLSTWAHSLSPRSDWQHVQKSYVATLQACRRLGPMTVLVRPHPAVPDSGEGLLAMANQMGLDGVRLGDGELRELLVASDVVVCFDSNAGVEALLLDRPLITLRFPPWRANLFEERDGVTIATSEREVDLALERFLHDPAFQAEMGRRRLEAIPRFNHLNDGRAVERLIHLVDQLAERGRQQAPQLTVAMRCLNQLPELKATLPAWQSHQVVVVDRGSTDGTREWLDERAIPWVEGTGSEEDMDRAWDVAFGDWLLWAEGPIEPLSGKWEWLMIRLRDPMVGAIAPQVIGENGWAGIGLMPERTAPFGRLLSPLEERAQRVWRVAACVGGVRLVRRGGAGEVSLYCPHFQVKAKGWDPSVVRAVPGREAPVPIW